MISLCFCMIDCCHDWLLPHYWLILYYLLLIVIFNSLMYMCFFILLIIALLASGDFVVVYLLVVIWGKYMWWYAIKRLLEDCTLVYYGILRTHSHDFYTPTEKVIFLPVTNSEISYLTDLPTLNMSECSTLSLGPLRLWRL